MLNNRLRGALGGGAGQPATQRPQPGAARAAAIETLRAALEAAPLALLDAR